MTDWATFAAAVSTGVVGLAAIAATLSAGRASRNAELRRARFDRATALYSRLATATQELRLVVGEQAYLYVGESREKRDERHERIMRGAQEHVGEVGGQILVDPVVSQVRDAHTTVYNLVGECLRAVRWSQPGLDRAQQIATLTDQANAAADRVLELARRELAALEAPPASSFRLCQRRIHRLRLRRRRPAPKGGPFVRS